MQKGRAPTGYFFVTKRSPVSIGARIALVVLGLLIALWLLVQLRSIVVLLLIALTLATGIHPAVEWLHARTLPPGKWHPPRWLAILSTLFAITVVVLGICYFIGVIAWREGVQVWKDIPAYVDGWSGWLAGLREEFPKMPSGQELGSAVKEELGQTKHYIGQTTSAVFGLLGGIGSALTVLVLVFYMLLEREKLCTAVLSLVPPARQAGLREATEEALITMGGWLRGQAILVFAMTTIITAVMGALGLPHPFLLGLLGGVGELIPMVGPIAAGLVAVPLALLTMPLWIGVVVTVFFVVLSVVEGNVIVPKVMKANVGLPPFFTVVAVLAGGALAGVTGALLALPLAAALRVYLKRLVVPVIQSN